MKAKVQYNFHIFLISILFTCKEQSFNFNCYFINDDYKWNFLTISLTGQFYEMKAMDSLHLLIEYQSTRYLSQYLITSCMTECFTLKYFAQC